MKSYRKELWFEVPTRRAFINITPQVEECLHESGIKEGIVLCNTMHMQFIKIQSRLKYLFWEPENSSKFDLFQKHRDELDEFAREVAKTSIRFLYQSYQELWSEWIAEDIFETHVKKLQARYSIKL